MNNLENKFKRQLDQEDKRFLKKFSYITKLIKINKLKRVKTNKELEKSLVELKQMLDRRFYFCLREHAKKCFYMGKQHAKLEILYLEKTKGLKLAAPPEFGLEFWLVPEKALKAIEERQLVLSGDVTENILSRIKSIMTEKLHGKNELAIETEIAEALNSSINRGQLISITESTYYYNKGRLSTFKKDGVEYVQFSAIMDNRTSPQCVSRHGKVMRVDSPELAGNMPPLHGRCRSILKAYFDEPSEEQLDWNETFPLPKGWGAKK